jgi:ankyrin repeat protein
VTKEDPEMALSGKLRTTPIGDIIPEQDPETECRWQNNALHIAARTNNLEAARTALEQNSDFLNMQNLRGETPLHIAAQVGSQPILNILLEKCCDVSILTSNKMTALHFASIHENQSLAEALIARKASVNAVNFWRWTPLHYAARARATATVKVFLKNLAAIDATTEGGNTPLHFAAENQDEALMQILIEEGKPRQDLKNGQGLTPADVLRMRQETIRGGLLLE